MFELIITWVIGIIIFLALILHIVGTLVAAPFKDKKGQWIAVVVGVIAVYMVIKRLLDKREKTKEEDKNEDDKWW